MRAEGQLKTGVAAGSSEDAEEPVTPAGLSWGDADLPPPKTARSGADRDIKGVFGLGAPPPPAGAMLDQSDDPVAGLFASDQTLPTPGINDAPSEAELGRWAATNRTSMFEEQVKDPPPPLREGPRASQPGQRISQPGLRREPARMLELDIDATEPMPDPMPDPMMEPPPAPEPERKRRVAPRAQTAQGLAPPPPPAAAAEAPPAPPSAALKEPAAAAPEPRAAALAPATPAAAGRSGVRKAAKAIEQAPARASEPEAASVPPPKRRRFEHGTSKVQLIGLGAAVLVVLGSAGVLLDLIPLSGSSTGSISQAAGPHPAPNHAAPARAAAAPKLIAAAPTAVAAKASPVAVNVAPAAAKRPEPAKAQVVATTPAAVLAQPARPIAQPAKPIAQPEPSEAAAESGAEPTGESSSEKALAQARKLLAADNPEAAEALARQALTADAQDHHAMEVLVRALMDQDRGPDAVPFARKMVQKRGKRVPYRLLLGDLLLMVGDEAGARSEWQKALELAPTDKEIKRRLGQ